jgi:hypothetical protein
MGPYSESHSLAQILKPQPLPRYFFAIFLPTINPESTSKSWSVNLNRFQPVVPFCVDKGFSGSRKYNRDLNCDLFISTINQTIQMNFTILRSAGCITSTSTATTWPTKYHEPQHRFTLQRVHTEAQNTERRLNTWLNTATSVRETHRGTLQHRTTKQAADDKHTTHSAQNH